MGPYRPPSRFLAKVVPPVLLAATPTTTDVALKNQATATQV